MAVAVNRIPAASVAELRQAISDRAVMAALELLRDEARFYWSSGNPDTGPRQSASAAEGMDRQIVAQSKEPSNRTQTMSIDIATARRIARLARVALSDDEAEKTCGELNEILIFIEQLLEVDVEGIPPMTSVVPTMMKMRQDVVTEGNNAEEIVTNAPLSKRNFFVVPKILE